MPFCLTHSVFPASFIVFHYFKFFFPFFHFGNHRKSQEYSALLQIFVVQLGTGGVGYIYGRHEEEWRHSVAPIPADRLAEITHAIDDDQEFVTQDGTALSASGELMSDTNTNASEGDIREDSKDDFLYFEKEVNYGFN